MARAGLWLNNPCTPALYLTLNEAYKITGLNIFSASYDGLMFHSMCAYSITSLVLSKLLTVFISRRRKTKQPHGIYVFKDAFFSTRKKKKELLIIVR